MARGSVNKVILIGNLGRDPEIRYTQNGMAVANIAIATSEVWKDKQTGENQERTEWHRVVMYQRLAEIAGEYLKKGSKIYIEGRLQTRKWQDKTSGQDRYSTEIVAETLQMLDSKQNNDASFSGGASQNNKAQSDATPPANNDPHAALEAFDDDIPF